MTLYEIDSAITALIDPETGEVLDYEAFEALAFTREAKLENTALYIKNLDAEAAAIQAEEQALEARRKRAQNKAASLRAHLSQALSGEKFSTPRVAVSFRKSEALQILDIEKFIEWTRIEKHPEFLNFGRPIPNKTKIAAEIQGGMKIPGVTLETHNNIQIK
ncbi:MAG: siphovirus Gp157 family protein [Oscillospiraceae bacterium]|jgi:hypothetical protein|nr:siphovirus Gp157 family protein [Oscillospiraceae bacterium]